MMSYSHTRTALSRIVAVGILVAVVVAAIVTALLVTGVGLQQQAPKEVRIGITMPLTGALAFQGQDQKTMFDLVFQRVNEAGGIRSLGGAKVTPIYVDDTNKAEVGRSELRRLVTEDKVNAMILGGTSGVAIAQTEEGERLGIPMVGTTQSATVLTQRGLKWYFRTWLTDREFARLQFELIKVLRDKGEEINKLALAWDTNLFGRGLRDEWLFWNKDAKLGGYAVVEDIGYNTGVTDVSTEVLKLKAAKPHVLLMAVLSPADALLWQKTFKRQDFNIKGIITTGGGAYNNPDFIKGAGKDGNYILIRDAWSRDILKVKPAAARIVEDFESKTGKSFYVFPMVAHTSATVVLDAIEKARSLDSSKVRDALARTDLKPDQIVPLWNGVRFNENGDNVAGSPIILQLLDGKWSLVYPFEHSVAKMVFPQPTWAERS